jgi:hypothetical protein
MNPFSGRNGRTPQRRTLPIATATVLVSSAAVIAGLFPAASASALPAAGDVTVPVGIPGVSVPAVPSPLAGVPSSGAPASTPQATSTSPSAGSGSLGSMTPASVSAFQVLSLTVSSTGRVYETIAVPGPGALAVNANEPRHLASARRSSRSRNTKRRAAARVTQVATIAVHVYGGIAVIVLNPRLHATKSRLVIATTYTPFGGVATTITRSVALKRASSSGRKHR